MSEKPVVLVTGPPAQVTVVGDALHHVGYDAVAVSDPDTIHPLWRSLAPRSLAGYVQLPVEDAYPPGTNRDLLTKEVLDRIDGALAVIPLLRPDACVIIVAGNEPDALRGPEDRRARRGPLQVLARVISGASIEGSIKAIVVSDASPEEIAHLAHQRGEDRNWLHTQLDNLPHNLNYHDWRQEMMSLTDLDGQQAEWPASTDRPVALRSTPPRARADGGSVRSSSPRCWQGARGAPH